MNYTKRMLLVIILLGVVVPIQGEGLYPFFYERSSLSQLIIGSSVGLLFVSVSYMIVTVADAVRIDMEEKRAVLLTQVRQRARDVVIDADTVENS